MIDYNIVYILFEYGLNFSVFFKFDCFWCGGFNNGLIKMVIIVYNILVNVKN